MGGSVSRENIPDYKELMFERGSDELSVSAYSATVEAENVTVVVYTSDSDHRADVDRTLQVNLEHSPGI